MTPENGPMRFIPGSHKARKISSHSWQVGKDKTINMVCDAEHFEENDASSLIIRAGQMSFHDVYMIHGSQANRTNRRRAAFIIRLMPAFSFYDHELGVEVGKKHPMQGYGEIPLYLVSGADKAGNNFEIGHFSYKGVKEFTIVNSLKVDLHVNVDLSFSPFMTTRKVIYR